MQRQWLSQQARHVLLVAAVTLLGLLLTGIIALMVKNEFEREVALLTRPFFQRIQKAVRDELSEHYEKAESWRDMLELLDDRPAGRLAMLFRSHVRTGSLPGIREVSVLADTPGASAGKAGGLAQEFSLTFGSEGARTQQDIVDPEAFLRAAGPLASESQALMLTTAQAGLKADSRHVLILPIVPAVLSPRIRPTRWLVVGLDFNALLAKGMSEGLPPGMRLSLQDSATGVDLGELQSPGAKQSAEASSRHLGHLVSFGPVMLALSVALSAEADFADAQDWSWTVAVSGMIVTLLLAYGCHALLVRGRKLSERTRELQSSIRDSEQRFRDIVESSRDWMWETDLDGVYTYSSPSSERLFGYPPERIVGTKGQFLWMNGNEDAPSSAGRSRMRIFRHLSGAVVTLESHSVPLVSEEGKVLGFRGFDKDVSQRIQLKTELHTLQARLLKVIQAEGAGQTLMGLAHEINQPLAAIAAYNQACLRMAESGANVTDDMRAAIRATAENAVLAGDIIRKFRSAVAATRVHREAMAPGRVIQDAVEITRSRLRSEGIRIAVDAGSGLPEVLGDATLIKQLMLNLIGNAADAMTGQAVRELIILARESPPDKVWVEVLDTGTGVREQFRDKIFEPYFTTKADGLGMGLAICKSIIEAHGESIDFKPRPGGGTSFRFSLSTKDN